MFVFQITPPASPTNHRRTHSKSVSSSASSRSNSPSSRVGSPEKGTLTRSKSMSAASHKPAPPVRRSSVLSPQRESYLEKHLGTSRLSISSQDSATNQSYYSSMSSLDSQSVDCLPPPPAPLIPPAPPSPNPSEASLPPPPPMEEIIRGLYLLEIVYFKMKQSSKSCMKKNIREHFVLFGSCLLPWCLVQGNV